MRCRMAWDREDRQIAKDLSAFDRKVYACQTLVPLNYEEYFRETGQYRSIALSVGIEDDRLGETVALLVLVEGANERAPAEVQLTNLQDAYRLARDLAADPSTRLDNGLIRALNALILRGEPNVRGGGQFRTQATAVVDARTQDICYRPPPPAYVPTLMDHLIEDLNAWVDEGVPGPIVAALAHFGMVSIHPFTDGNGRTARLLADMILLQTGSSADGMLSVSEVLHKRLYDYYDTLRAVQGDDFRDAIDVGAWVAQHTVWLKEAATLLEEKLVRHRGRLSSWQRKFGEVLNSRQRLGLMFAAEIRPISSTVYARLNGTSPTSAKTDLNQLIDLGALKRVGSGPSTRYEITPEWGVVAPDSPTRDAASVGNADGQPRSAVNSSQAEHRTETPAME